jgi:hypothetical protein
VKPKLAKGVVLRWVAAGLMLVLAGVIFYLGSGPLDDYLTGNGPVPATTDPRRSLPDGSLTSRTPQHVVVRTETLPDGTVIEHIEPQTDRRPGDGAMVMGLSMPDSGKFLPEPAGLKPPDHAISLLRYASPEDPPLERTSVWSVADASLASVASYYQTQAKERGFDLLQTSQATDKAVQRSVFRAKNQLLTVRCRQVGDAVRVVIQLRYTTVRGSD